MLLFCVCVSESFWFKKKELEHVARVQNDLTNATACCMCLQEIRVEMQEIWNRVRARTRDKEQFRKFREREREKKNEWMNEWTKQRSKRRGKQTATKKLKLKTKNVLAYIIHTCTRIARDQRTLFALFVFILYCYCCCCCCCCCCFNEPK